MFPVVQAQAELWPQQIQTKLEEQSHPQWLAHICPLPWVVLSLVGKVRKASNSYQALATSLLLVVALVEVPAQLPGQVVWEVQVDLDLAVVQVVLDPPAVPEVEAVTD
jgi:hypothetical protein